MNLRVPSMGRLVMPLGKRDLDLLQKMKTRAFLEKVLYKSEKSDKIFSVDGVVETQQSASESLGNAVFHRI